MHYGGMVIPWPWPPPEPLKAIFRYIDMNNSRMHRDRRPLAKKEINKNVLETPHKRRIHHAYVKKNDQEAAAEVDQMQTERCAEIKSHRALFTPEKTIRRLNKAGRRIF
jgi:hypothetical protein